MHREPAGAADAGRNFCKAKVSTEGKADAGSPQSRQTLWGKERQSVKRRRDLQKQITASHKDLPRRGGGEESRTPVRKSLAKGFSERSRCFKFPLPHRPSTGYAVRQLLMCDKARSDSLFTFTADRRPLHGRGTPCRNEQLTLLKQLYCCQLFLKCGFYGGSAPPLASRGS